ncbi:hypothetical protein ES708_16087 [subsurface metagenome]
MEIEVSFSNYNKVDQPRDHGQISQVHGNIVKVKEPDKAPRHFLTHSQPVYDFIYPDPPVVKKTAQKKVPVPGKIFDQFPGRF